jgi:hypothetical protein
MISVTKTVGYIIGCKATDISIPEKTWIKRQINEGEWEYHKTQETERQQTPLDIRKINWFENNFML